MANSNAISRAHAAARIYHERGFSVIPLPPGEKGARRSWLAYQSGQSSEDVEREFANCPNANIGIITGRVSGMVAIDVDGAEGRSSIAAYLSEAFDGPTSITARGYHALFTHPGFDVKTEAGILPGVDVRGDGGYIVAPPSVHETGHVYRWASGLDAPEALASLPAELEELLRAHSPRHATTPAKLNAVDRVMAGVVEGERNTRLTAAAGQLFGDGMSAGEVRDKCHALNAAHCHPPLPDKEVDDIVRSIGKAERARNRVETKPKAWTQALSEITAAAPKWLWPGYVPLGALTMLDGDPGLGKSTLTLDLAARVTTGRPMPDGSAGADGAVILMSTEENVSTTIVPNFTAMGGDVTRIHTLSVGGQDVATRGAFQIPRDTELLAEKVRELGAALVIFDPLVAHISARTNTWNDQEVRLAFTRLLALAQQLDFAIIGVRHLSKKMDVSALHSGGGSVAFVGSARATFLVGRDPRDPDVRVLATNKVNVGKSHPSLAFRIATASSGAACLEWEGITPLTAEDLRHGTPESLSKVDAAVEFLRRLLADGERLTSEVNRLAADEKITVSTLTKARAALNVQTRRLAGAAKAGHVMWLPKPDIEPQDTTASANPGEAA